MCKSNNVLNMLIASMLTNYRLPFITKQGQIFPPAIISAVNLAPYSARLQCAKVIPLLVTQLL